MKRFGLRIEPPQRYPAQHAIFRQFAHHVARIARQDHGELVDVDVIEHAHPRHLAQRLGGPPCRRMVHPRQLRQPVAAQQRHVDRKRQRTQPGIGADVAGRLLAPDMLLAGRQRQHEPALAVGIHRLPAQPPRHLPHELLAAPEQAQIRPAELQAHPQRLPLAHHDVRAQHTRGLDQPQRDRLGHHRDQQRALGVRRIGNRGEIGNAAQDVGILHHHCRSLTVDCRDQRGVIRLRDQLRDARVDHVAGKPGHRRCSGSVVRMQSARQQHFRPFRDPPGHRDGLPARGRSVVHRCIGHLGSEQPRHLRLELEQHLQRTLRDFRLVRGIGGQELAALDQVIDRGRNMVAIGPCPKEKRRRSRRQVLRSQRGHVPLDRHFAGVQRQPRHRTGQPRLGRYISKQLVDRASADHAEHVRPFGRSQGKIPHRLTTPSRTRRTPPCPSGRPAAPDQTAQRGTASRRFRVAR